MTNAVIEPVARLVEAFARLPGIGPKTAQRLTYHLLRAPDAEARALARALIAVRDEVLFCDTCFNISDAPLCPICTAAARPPHIPQVLQFRRTPSRSHSRATPW